ncbi:MAG: N-acetyltransferase [Myxococcota bacterium]|nr:N-acetyltransferase [Myxococcota bacterium]
MSSKVEPEVEIEVEVEVREADLADPQQARAVVEIVDSYARGPGGQNAPLSDEARAAMIPGLRAHPMALVLLAFEGQTPAGIAVCVFGFSTFAGKPLLNIHDLAVLPDRRGRGIGAALIAEAERRARERDGCRLTLEVLESNTGAQRLYRASGFGPWDEDRTLFVSKSL